MRYNSTESDVLLLDISNNDEYVWTNIFHPTPPTPKHVTQTIIGIVIGSLIGGISLLFGGLFIYKKNKNKRKNKKVIPILGNDEVNIRIVNDNKEKATSS